MKREPENQEVINTSIPQRPHIKGQLGHEGVSKNSRNFTDDLEDVFEDMRVLS